MPKSWSARVRFCRAATQVLPTATEVAKDVHDIIAEMAEGKTQARVMGTTCYETLPSYTQVLGRDRDAPVQHEGRGEGRQAFAKGKRTSPRDVLYASYTPTHMAQFRSSNDGRWLLRTVSSFQGHLSLRERKSK